MKDGSIVTTATIIIQSKGMYWAASDTRKNGTKIKTNSITGCYE